MDVASRLVQTFVGRVTIVTWNGALGLARADNLCSGVRLPAINATREVSGADVRCG